MTSGHQGHSRADGAGLLLALLGSLLLIAGCGSVSPNPYSETDIEARVEQDLLAMYGGQEPITGPLSFEQAAARALKYNLDARLKLMESALAQNLAEAATQELLPSLVTGAGYAGRNNDSGGRSIGIEDRIESLRPSTAQERERVLGNLAFSWNVLDFGVSYFRARQRADQVLMAEERRRKVVQNLLQDVRNSYWRAVGAQQLIDRVDALLQRVRSALARARQVEAEGLLPQAEVLAYQRALLDAVNLLTLRRQDLELARAELGALMSLAPGTSYSLASAGLDALPPVPGDIEALERLALENRPELLEEWYRQRVTETDIKAAKLLVWPNLNLDAVGQYDSNVYNYNERWVDAGVRLSWNLLKLVQLPALQEAQRQQVLTDETRRLALSMAVLTQVRVAVQRYGLSLAELEFAEQSLRVDQRLLTVAQAGASSNVASELELIRTEARGLLAEYQRYASYSNAQAAWGRLYNSLGLDALPATLESDDLTTLARELGTTLQANEAMGLLAVPKPQVSAILEASLPTVASPSDEANDTAAVAVTTTAAADPPMPAAGPLCTPTTEPAAPGLAAAARAPQGTPATRQAAGPVANRDAALVDLREALTAARTDYLKRPRRQVLSLSAPPPSALSAYLDSWRSRLRQSAMQRFVPTVEACRNSASLRLLIALKADGSVESVRILSSSGLREIDEAALEAVQQAAPFAPFPAGVSAETDVLEILGTWRYTPSAGLVL